MLEKKVPFCIDHFSIATTHRDRPIDLVTKLGFTTADCYTDRTVHFIFENSYFELCTYQLNTTITWLTQSVPATNLPKVHSYRLSVKGTDPNPMRNALIEGGIETIGEINNPFRQHVRYGEKEGEAGYQTFFIQNYEPFTDILFGCTTHLAKELIVKNETKFPHINGAKRLAYITGYCDSKERFEEADAAISKLYNAAKGATDTGFNLDTYQLVDHDAYRSQISGVCHACGHDAHTANLLGVANYISDHRTEFCGTIKFLFQPAEELLEGAKLVCQSGVLDGTDYILGQHAVLDVDVGQVQVCYGPSNGGGDEFTLRLHGVGCHGARPHTGKDPILLAAKVIEGFQQIISRELDPLKAAVISVCSVQAGQHESKNVVPQEAVLAGTVRTLEEDVRTYVLTRMEEIVAGLCSASRCSYTLEHVTKVPPLTSDQQLTQLVENTAVELVGRENVLYRPAPTMGVEDFSWYTRNYNACMFYFGARNVEKGIITRGHNPKFDIDEECFRVAMPMFILLSKRLMLD